MKKIIGIFFVALIAVLFLTSCTTIDERYTGKRVRTEPSEAAVEEEAYRPVYRPYYYDPFYGRMYDPFFWGGLSIWNPFWHYGFLGYYYYGYYAPYVWGYSPYYFYRGGRYWRGRYIRTYVTRDQLKKRSVGTTPQVRSRGTSTRTKITTGVRARSLAPRTSPRTGSVSRGAVKIRKKK